jgi:rhodanese-related sulfurtransferase
VFGHDDKTYVLYCAAAWRSALTAKTLNDMGMTNVVQFADGFKAWKEAGGPVALKSPKDA